MLTEVAAALRCPHCRQGLRLQGRTARCGEGHAFDLAKQGYLNLLPSASTGIEGDTADMVAARTAFLAEGHYAPIRDALATLTSTASARSVNRPIVEIGAGTAYYLAGAVESVPGVVGVALDVSRYAARRAAKAHERIGAVVADAWRELPLLDDSAQVLLNVSPRATPPKWPASSRPTAPSSSSRRTRHTWPN
ncbi:putative RNA methyltransferase [Kribbella deserti]|uniref:RNA methyltransferase n=1 Tax=Kribbella deserti TaxID=1926257 RepID=A0ABV6QMN8_9ACTN